MKYANIEVESINRFQDLSFYLLPMTCFMQKGHVPVNFHANLLRVEEAEEEKHKTCSNAHNSKEIHLNFAE